MTDQEMYTIDLYHHGHDAALTQISGTTCPCMTWRDPDNPSYSAEWHRLNPTADPCNGTGLIDTTTTNTSIKAFFYPPTALPNRQILTKEMLAVIGEIAHDDLMLFGSVDATTGVLVDLTGLNEARDYITYNSQKYLARHVFSLHTNIEVGQFALLKRIS